MEKGGFPPSVRGVSADRSWRSPLARAIAPGRRM